MKKYLFILFILIATTASAQLSNTAFFKKRNSILRFPFPPGNLNPDICSNGVSLQHANERGVTANPSAPLNVTLSSIGPVGIYANADCTVPLTTTTIQTYESTKTIFLKSSGTGAFSITATAANRQPGSFASTVLSTPRHLWTGGGANASWHNAQNWSGNGVPGGSDVAVFNGSCATNCSPQILSNVTVGGVKIENTYAGTITQTGAFTMSVQSSQGWDQRGGTFVGGTGNIDIYGSFKVLAGSYTSTSAQLRIEPQTTSDNSIDIQGTFNPSAGRIFLGGYRDTAINTSNVNFNDVSFSSNSSYYVTGEMTILGVLRFSGNAFNHGIQGGTIVAKGNVIFTDTGYAGGTGLLKIAGTANQSIDASSVTEGNIAKFEIASDGGTVTLKGTISPNLAYTYTRGTVDASLSTIKIGRNSAVSTARFGGVSYKNITFNGAGASTDISTGLTATGNVLIDTTEVRMPNPGNAFPVNIAGVLTNNSGTTLRLYGAPLTYGSRTGAGTVIP